jgi:hypothetical protein
MSLALPATSTLMNTLGRSRNIYTQTKRQPLLQSDSIHYQFKTNPMNVHQFNFGIFF